MFLSCLVVTRRLVIRGGDCFALGFAWVGLISVVSCVLRLVWGVIYAC